MASPDVRVRVRESVIRVRVSETAIRAVIRITAPQDKLIPLYLPLSPVGFRSEAAHVSEPRLAARHRFRKPWFFLRKDRCFSLFQRTQEKFSVRRFFSQFMVYQHRLLSRCLRNKQGEPRWSRSSTRKRNSSARKRDRNTCRHAHPRPTGQADP